MAHAVKWTHDSARKDAMGISMRRGCFIAVTLAALLAAGGARAADFRIDTVHTQVFFSVSHLGFSHSTGRFKVKGGFIRFDADDWPQSSAEVVIDVASVDMGDAAWSDKLRSHEFFETGKYPTARFVSTRVEKTGERTGIVHGKLTLLGVTRPVDLNVTFNRSGPDPLTLAYTAGFSATASLKRSDFGIRKYASEIGDDVELRMEVEGLRDRHAEAHTEEPAKDREQ